MFDVFILLHINCLCDPCFRMCVFLCVTSFYFSFWFVGNNPMVDHGPPLLVYLICIFAVGFFLCTSKLYVSIVTPKT